MGYTLKKEERLVRGDFRGTKWTTYGETAHFRLLKNENPFYTKRIGITIRKKTGGAVARNRMRRYVKEFYRLNKGLFRNSCHYLIKVRKMPENLIWTKVTEELQQLLVGSKG